MTTTVYYYRYWCNEEGAYVYDIAAAAASRCKLLIFCEEMEFLRKNKSNGVTIYIYSVIILNILWHFILY